MAAAPGLGAVDVAQRFVLERIAAAVRALGPPVEVLGSGDLTLARRKVAGSAQRRLRHHFLVHATILYRFPLERIARYLGPPRREPSYRQGRPHEEFVANLDLPRAALVGAIRSAWLPPGQAGRRGRRPRGDRRAPGGHQVRRPGLGRAAVSPIAPAAARRPSCFKTDSVSVSTRGPAVSFRSSAGITDGRCPSSVPTTTA